MTTLTLPRPAVQASATIPQPAPVVRTQCGKLESKIIWIAIRLRLLYLALITLRRPREVIRAYHHVTRLRRKMWDGKMRKLYRVGGRYFFSMYSPGWPSKQYDETVRYELKRFALPGSSAHHVRFTFFAITRKCPMRCEHCFEWENLNKPESFAREELTRVVDLYQEQGNLQFQFSGGEPMVRLDDLLHLLNHARAKSECWVVTSGFNLTEENAARLKKAGCTGVVISLDHYDPDLHNAFRGHRRAFDHAVSAIRAARKKGLVVAVSVCATKTFLDGSHLLPYIDFVSSLGVHFIQVLEPKNVGHYQGKDVLLEERHIASIEKLFREVNSLPAYRDYPTLAYHGYHQRRIGCFSGDRSIYIDSAGNVHACPFCHTHAFNILEWMKRGEGSLPVKENYCPRFERIA